MKKNEKYWLNLYNTGQIEIDFETGIVISHLTKANHVLGAKTPKGKYNQSSAGPSRKERNHILLHRLVWIAANGDIPENIETNHKNGIKDDNRLENLELVNKSGNALHSRRVLGNKGGVARGEKAGTAKLKWEDVDKIREIYAIGGKTKWDIAKELNINYSTLIDVIKQKTWKPEWRDNS